MTDPNDKTVDKEIVDLESYIEEYKEKFKKDVLIKRGKEALEVAKDVSQPSNNKEKKEIQADTAKPLSEEEELVSSLKFEDYEDKEIGRAHV